MLEMGSSDVGSSDVNSCRDNCRSCVQRYLLQTTLISIPDASQVGRGNRIAMAGSHSHMYMAISPSKRAFFPP